MITLIPLAGPDVLLPNGHLRPLFPVDDTPLIKRAIESRSWFQSGEVPETDLIFVLREGAGLKELKAFVSQEWPQSKFVIIPHLTRGALLTALAGTSLIKNFEEPVVVDLVDILYEAPSFSPSQLFLENPACVGIIPYFESEHPKYSYLEIENGVVKRTREKQVISSHASAGTYFFRSLSVFLSAVADSLRHVEDYSVRGNLFLCPSFNGIIAADQTVLPVLVSNVRSLSLLFHQEE